MAHVRVTAGLTLAIVGLVMIVTTAALAVLADEPLPISFAGAGLDLFAAGPSKHRADTAPASTDRAHRSRR